MKRISHIAVAILLTALAVTLSSSLLADSKLPTVSGEVKKIKLKSGKITIKHEPIPNLEMPGMTMVFRVKEGTDISQFKKGDAVQFTVTEEGGKMLILNIEKSE